MSAFVFAGLLAFGGSATAAGGPGALATMPIPGGVDALAAAAGLPTPAPRATVCLEVIRRLHAASDGDGSALAERRRAVTAVLEATSGPSADVVPLPFGETVWATGVFSRRVPGGNLALATLTAPRPAFLYYGAMGLDDETRAWFAADPGRIERMGLHAPGAFAAFGPSLRIRAGQVETPGGEGAAAIWKELVGASPADAGAFVDALFAQRAGRLVWLYDTIARLDAGQQKHLFGGDAKAALSRVRKLADVFEKVYLEWRIADRPFWRPRVDPAAFLLGLDASPDGVLVLPPPSAWASTLGSSDRVDAAWLAERVFLADPGRARDRLELVRFAARWRVRAGDSSPNAALTLFAKAPLAALVLERTGVTDDALTARLLALIDGPVLRKDPSAPRLFQASLAFVERAALAGSFDASTSRTLLLALLDRIDAEELVPGTRKWLADHLHPACQPMAPAAAWDAQLVAALAGPAPGNPPRVEWEGQSYTVDRPAAERDRMARLQAAQGSPSLERAVTAAVAVTPGKPQSDGSRRAGAELADALVALVYSAVLPATDPELLASRVDLRHDLDAGERPGAAADRRRWVIAEPLSGGGTPWHLAGSLVSMDVALAVPALRRVSDDPPAPVLPAADRIAFARTAALMGRHVADDRNRDAVLEVVARGRARLKGITMTPGAALDVARAAGLSPWRREGLVWSLTHDPAILPRAFSTTELAWLGVSDLAARKAALDAWGTSAMAASGELATRFPPARPWEDVVGHDASAGLAASLADLNLRVAAFLADRKLPSALAPDILSAATLELVDRVNAPRADDWRALVESIRAIPDARFEDYVAALTADGPLRPVRNGETGQ